MFKNYLAMLWGTSCKVFTYSGRASRKEYWLFIIVSALVNLVFGVFCAGLSAISTALGMPFVFIFILVFIAELLICLSLTIRRLHDLSLSGFWLLYLNPVLGLPLIYIVYLLGVDASCERFIENIKKVGSPWLGWILLWLLWPIGVCGTMFLLCLSAGKKEANEFGENPYAN